MIHRLPLDTELGVYALADTLELVAENTQPNAKGENSGTVLDELECVSV